MFVSLSVRSACLPACLPVCPPARPPATGRVDKPDPVKCALLLRTTGQRGNDIYESFTWETDEDKDKYDKLVENFAQLCAPRKRELRKTQYHYNKHARDLPPIKEGSPVFMITIYHVTWLPSRNKAFTYFYLLTHKRLHIAHAKVEGCACVETTKPISTDDPLNQVQSVPVDSQGTYADSSVQSTNAVIQIVTTRSGRMSRSPNWQKDYSL